LRSPAQILSSGGQNSAHVVQIETTWPCVDLTTLRVVMLGLKGNAVVTWGCAENAPRPRQTGAFAFHSAKSSLF
jgi:hypothetical protein